MSGMQRAQAAKAAATRRSRDVEWLAEWALGVEKADWHAPTGGLDVGGSALARIGCAVDGGGSGGRVNEDAFRIACAIVGLGELGRAVARWAIAGTRPDWHPRAQHRFVAEMEPDGRKVRQIVQNKRVVFVWLREVDAPDVIEQHRALYAQWREGLVRLQARLEGRLVGYEAIGPAAPARPWEDDSRVLVAGGHEALTGLRIGA